MRNNSFSIFEGQITGVFGLIGSGRTETFKIVSGIYKRDFLRGGDIELDGRPVRYNVPRQAVKDGIVYVTEDRKIRRLLRNHVDRGESLFRPARGRPRAACLCQHARDARLSPAEWTRARSTIRAINDNARVVELSGGNQQKVVIGKGLVQTPRLVIFDEPTRGVDVGAIAEIHQLINGLADDGLAVDRDLVLSAGDHEPLRPHPGLPPGPHRRGVLARRCDRGEDHVRGGALGTPQLLTRSATVPTPTRSKLHMSPACGKRVGATLPVSTTSPARSARPEPAK